MSSDEFRLTVTRLPWREKGKRYAQQHARERDPYDSGMLVRAGIIMHNGRTALHIFERGSVTLQR